MWLIWKLRAHSCSVCFLPYFWIFYFIVEILSHFCCRLKTAHKMRKKNFCTSTKCSFRVHPMHIQDITTRYKFMTIMMIFKFFMHNAHKLWTLTSVVNFKHFFFVHLLQKFCSAITCCCHSNLHISFNLIIFEQRKTHKHLRLLLFDIKGSFRIAH